MKLFLSVCIMTLPDIDPMDSAFCNFLRFLFMDLNTLLQEIASCLFCL